MRRFFRTSFGSALLGGVVVAVLGGIAVAAGLLDTGHNTTTTITAPLSSAPVANTESNDASNTVNQIYRHDGPGVAFIESTEPAEESSAPFNPFGGEEESRGGGIATGSGFLIDDEGHIVTNNHVVEGATKVEVRLGSSDTEHEAEVVGADPATDVALLKIDVPADQQHPLELGNSAKVQVGDPVVAIGNPFGLDRTVTAGIVSALQRQIQAPNGFSISHVIQTDAAINPGNSGGPLIDAEGKVIGINSQIQTGGSGDGNVGIGFAVPINTAREVVEQIEKNGKVEHAFIGISGGSITPALAKALKLPVEEGVLVNEVTKGSPADKAGIEGGDTEATIEGVKVTLGGDIITEIDGKKLKSMDELVEIIQGLKPGDELELTIIRDGDEKSADVTLGTQPEKSPTAE
jgi:S1-C subfamily serine protease